MLSGKEHIIRIKSFESVLTRSESLLEGEIPETKNATAFASNAGSLNLCVAVKNRILFYKIHSYPQPYLYTLVRELDTIQNVMYLEMSTLQINNNEEEILWFGYSSTFMAQNLDHQSSATILLRDTDPTLRIFQNVSIEVLRVIPVTSQLLNSV